MFLRQLELSGFKSFAKRTTLDFPGGITAIVGPNGTGKSNISDAIRWVLTEQSFKSLRGKKSEDLIFHGSSLRRPLSQAKVSLYLVNNKGKAPVDLEDVVVTRQVARDGQNYYFLNGRRVRLMDLEVFLAKSGIGASSFRVLSQGMSDMLVSLGPQEFKEFIEDAAGVKEYQDKKHRSLLKIHSARRNVDKVETLMVELKPRLRFLKRESDKFGRRDKIEQELKKEVKKLFGFRHYQLVIQEKETAKEKKKTEEKLKALESEVEDIKEELFSFERKNIFSQEVGELTQNIRRLEEEERKLSQKIIFLQGKISLIEERIKQTIPVTKEYLTKELSQIIEEGRRGGKGNLLARLLERLGELLAEITAGRKKETKNTEEEIGELKKESKSAGKEREEVKGKINQLIIERSKKEEGFSQNSEQLIEKEKLWQEKAEQSHQLRLKLNEIYLKEEKLLIRKEQLNHDLKNLGVLTLAEVAGTEENKKDINEQELDNKIWELKGKLNEIGGIDPEVQKECEGVKERYEFLEREFQDLKETIKSLEKLVRNLDHQIEELFKGTFKKMSESFAGYFRLMFGGGKASLVHKKYELEQEDEMKKEEDEDNEEDEGIEIKVDLPGKKIKNLGMLSGGERSLVSLALLFALVSVRQPPFLVLDEIDAALDETNSQRFMRLLKEMAKTTQFIIISHNRETMRGADALYGVSMKDGISCLLSIKLEKA